MLSLGKRMKFILITVSAGGLCVAGLAYWYVVVGSRWPIVAEEYARWKDYRLGFFLLVWLPVLLVVLVAVLWIERSLCRDRAPAGTVRMATQAPSANRVARKSLSGAIGQIERRTKSAANNNTRCRLCSR